MAKRKPITIDLGDEVDRPIRFSAEYSEALQVKHGDWTTLLKSDTHENIVAQLIYDGLIDRGEFTTPASIKGSLDASLLGENFAACLHALTGNKPERKNDRQIEDSAKNEATPLVQ